MRSPRRRYANSRRLLLGSALRRRRRSPEYPYGVAFSPEGAKASPSSRAPRRSWPEGFVATVGCQTLPACIVFLKPDTSRATSAGHALDAAIHPGVGAAG